MRNAVLATWVALGCATAGCKESTFQCNDDSACVLARQTGTCEANGYCSFPDAMCASGRRYGDLSSNTFADQCVPEMGSTGTVVEPPSSSSDSGTTSTDPTLLSSGSESTTAPNTTTQTSGELSSTEASGERPPGQPNYAFITSQLGLAAGLGRDGSDALCNQLAEEGGLPGDYVAWLADERMDAIDLLNGARGWILPNGKPFADRPQDIAAGYIWHPLNITESGQRVQARSVATGTTAEGRVSDRHCQNWTSTDEDDDYWDGVSGFTFDNWTSFTIQSCDTPSHLYCFGVDQNAPVSPDQAFGRVAFVTTETMPGSVGVDAFDAACTTEAAAAGLPGTYLAFVAVDGASPASRFDLTDTPWLNTFGVPTMESTDDLSANEVTLLAPINASASGDPIVVDVWVGASSPVDGASSNCSNWADAAATGRRERSDATDDWLAGMSGNCSTPNAVFCLQE